MPESVITSQGGTRSYEAAMPCGRLYGRQVRKVGRGSGTWQSRSDTMTRGSRAGSGGADADSTCATLHIKGPGPGR